ncbi:MAG: hypothetical protein RR475_12495 [Clostridia bacterium]
MKKRVCSTLCVVAMLCSLCTVSAVAAEDGGIAPLRASEYLTEYTIAVAATSNHRIGMGITVDGTGTMTKIGVDVIHIEKKVNGTWTTHDTLFGAEHPEFYQYNTFSYVDTVYFTGTAGVTYRVTITAFAQNNSGYDTGTVTSYTVTCK